MQQSLFEIPTTAQPQPSCFPLNRLVSKTTLLCGDCLQLLFDLPDGSIDYFFTSPPYNLGVTTGGGFPKKKAGKWNGGALQEGYADHDDAMPPKEYEIWQKLLLALMWRKLTPTGAIFYNHKPRIQDGIVQTPLEFNPGLPVRQVLIWKRAGGINFSPTFYLPTHEWVVVFAKQDFRLRSKGASGIGDVLDIPQERNNEHPAPFPIALPMKILETLNKGVVCDPFWAAGQPG